MRTARTALAAFAVASLLVALPPRSISQPQNNADPAATIPQVNSAPVKVTPQAAAPTLKVYTRETIVDITVTDAKGNPVHGLTRDDFTVKEDNKPQSIRSFNEYGTEAVAAPTKLPPHTYTNIQPPPASSAINVLLLDFTNAAPKIPVTEGLPGMKALHDATELQNDIKQDVRKYLQGMPTGTRVAVLGAAYPSRLHVLQGVTSDPALLSAAVDTMDYDTDAIARDRETWCTQEEMRNRMTIETLTQVAADLAAIKGRKNLIWFVSNMNTLVVERPPCLSDYAPDLHKAYGLLAAAEVTVFLVSKGPFLSSEAIAEDAGGVAFYGSSDLTPLIAKAIDFGSDYYTLSYAPPGSEFDGRHHSIKLEVHRPGLQLAYRKSYYAEDASKIPPTPGLIPGLTLALAADTKGPPDMRLQMTRAMPTSDALPFDVKVEPDTEPAKPDAPAVLGVLSPKVQGKPLTRYTLQYAILGSGIALPKGQGGLEFDLAAYDADGSLVTSLRQAIKLSYTPQDQLDLISTAFPYTQKIDLPSGQLFLRVGVLDRTSNKLGTLEIPLTVAKK